MSNNNTNSNSSSNNIPIQSLQQSAFGFKRSAPSNSSIFSTSAPSVMPGHDSSSFNTFMADKQQQRKSRFVPIAPAPAQAQYVPYPLQPTTTSAQPVNYDDLLLMSTEEADLINSGRFLREDASMVDESPLFYMDSPLVPANNNQNNGSATSSVQDFRQAQQYSSSQSQSGQNTATSQSVSASQSQSPATVRGTGSNSRNTPIPTVSPTMMTLDENNYNNSAFMFGHNDLDGFASMSLPDQRFIDVLSRNNGSNNSGIINNGHNQTTFDPNSAVLFASPANAPALKKDRSLSSTSTTALTSSAESIAPQQLLFDSNGINNQGLTEEMQKHIQLLEKQRKRRESHNAVERRRRDNINERIQELAILVPDCESSSGSSSSNKAGILKKSIDYIRSLQQEVTALRKELNKRR